MSREPLRIELEGQPRAVKVLAHGHEAVHAAELACARRAGEEAGRAEAALVLDQVVERLGVIEQEARTSLARAAAELALEIARTLLRRELAQGNYDLEKIVRETLSEAAVGRAPCVVHLHPLDHAALSAARFRSGTRIAADEGVARGDVHVETTLGLLVRDLDGALEAIQKRLQEELE